VTGSTISHDLKMLRESGLINGERPEHSLSAVQVDGISLSIGDGTLHLTGVRPVLPASQVIQSMGTTGNSADNAAKA
jgi:hypothetical protein